MDIYILENSSFNIEKEQLNIYYKIEDKINKDKCVKIEQDLKDFIPYEYLNPIQTIFFKYYEQGNCIVSTPTSSGKTGIIYITFYKNYQKNKDFKFIYTAPTKALIEEKFNEFSRYFNNIFKDNKKRVDIKTGDYFTKKVDKDCILITTTFDSLAIALRNNLDWIDNRNLIIIDEVHSFINNMGKFIPEILAISLEKNIPLILLSATLPIVNDLKDYIKSTLNIISNFRPVKLNKYYIHLTMDNIERNFLNKMKELKITKAKDMYILYVLKEAYNRAILGEKVIIFTWSKKLGWQFLQKSILFNLKIFNKTINFELENNSKNSNVNENKNIWIAFHNADIPYDERKEIEEAFRDEQSDLKILISTQTLALGVNLPADTAFINIKAYYNDNFNISLLPSNLDIIQEEGRVGRFGLKEEGFSFRTTWSVPYNIRKNIDYFIDNFDSKLFIKKYLDNSSIYNNIFLLILSSFKIFKDERLIYKSIFYRYLKNSLKEIAYYLTDLLKKWEFIDKNNELTFKGNLSLFTNIPPHYLNGFLSIYYTNSDIKIKYFDINKILAIRLLLHNKSFNSFNEMYSKLEKLEKTFFKYYNFPKFKIKEIISKITEYVGLFDFDGKNIEKIENGVWEYLFWISSIITSDTSFIKPIGEYSNLYLEANYLSWTLNKIIKYYNNLDKLNEVNFLKRYLLSLTYGCNPNYSVLAKIKNIAHKRLAIIFKILSYFNVNYLETEKDILNYIDLFDKAKNIIDNNEQEELKKIKNILKELKLKQNIII